MTLQSYGSNNKNKERQTFSITAKGEERGQVQIPCVVAFTSNAQFGKAKSIPSKIPISDRNKGKLSCK